MIGQFKTCVFKLLSAGTRSKQEYIHVRKTVTEKAEYWKTADKYDRCGRWHVITTSEYI